MRAIVLAGLSSLLATLPAMAALPPQYQRQAELAAIIADMGVVEAFGFNGIDAIELVEPDLYRVRGGKCALDVTIKDLPNKHGEGWVGPREFALAVGEASCTE